MYSTSCYSERLNFENTLYTYLHTYDYVNSMSILC
jgi:hypothetical protein